MSEPDPSEPSDPSALLVSPREEGAAPGEPSSADVLSLRGLSVLRGDRTVVRDVSIDVTAGEVTALLGPNGAGKSSLVLAVAGVLRLRAGSVLLDGRDLAGSRPERIRRAGVAVVPEGRRLLSELTVDDNIRAATYSLSHERATAPAGSAPWSCFPPWESPSRSRLVRFRGGSSRWSCWLKRWCPGPRFVLIDELSLGLAPVILRNLIPVIRTVAESGVGVLLIEQFTSSRSGSPGRACVMERGTAAVLGPCGELAEHPKLLHSAYLLASTGAAPDSSAAVDVVKRSVPSDEGRRHGGTERDEREIGSRSRRPVRTA